MRDQTYYDNLYLEIMQDGSFDEYQAKEIVQSIKEVDSGAQCYTAEEIRKSIYHLKKIGYATV